ncbi:unnamed protein product [Camellia sinensis]
MDRRRTETLQRQLYIRQWSSESSATAASFSPAMSPSLGSLVGLQIWRGEVDYSCFIGVIVLTVSSDILDTELNSLQADEGPNSWRHH